MSGHSLLTSEVPIVGQLVKIQGFTIVVTAACQCGTADPVQLVYQATAMGLQATPAVCAACRTVFAVGGIEMIRGQLQFNLQVQRPTASEAS